MSKKTKMDSYSSKIYDYYTKDGKDHNGRSLSQVLSYFDSILENSHDIVQWVFPTKEPSQFFKNAPVLSNEDIEAFKKNDDAKKNMQTAFQRYMKFYGIAVGEDSELKKSDNWTWRKREWLKANNHNHLRLTRILKSLKLFGLDDEAKELYIFLIDLSSTNEGKCFSPQTIKFWKEALEQ